MHRKITPAQWKARTINRKETLSKAINMKRTLLGVTVLAALSWASCQPANAYVDLETGETVTLEKDSTTGKIVNAETGKPVRLYVNKRTKDTIYGPTGAVANNKLRRTEEGKYVYLGDDNERKIKGDGYKEKSEDGDYKIKDGDYKKKVDEDGDVKIKNGDTKIKIDGETGEVKVKD
jgi:hypothetical protein